MAHLALVDPRSLRILKVRSALLHARRSSTVSTEISDKFTSRSPHRMLRPAMLMQPGLMHGPLNQNVAIRTALGQALPHPGILALYPTFLACHRLLSPPVCAIWASLGYIFPRVIKARFFSGPVDSQWSAPHSPPPTIRSPLTYNPHLQVNCQEMLDVQHPLVVFVHILHDLQQPWVVLELFSEY